MIRFFSITVCLLFAFSSFANQDWRQLSQGLQYKKITIESALTEGKSGSGFIHAFLIDPSIYRLDVITAKQFGMGAISAQTMKQKTGALITVNGGYFTPEFTSLGLLVQNNNKINNIKWTSWWHIFQIVKNVPHICAKQDFVLTRDIEMAIESGPRLVTDGTVTPRLKDGFAERSAIGITSGKKVVIAVTDASPLSLLDFASYMIALGTVNALNLDGGSSTQLYAKYKGFELSVPSFAVVANGIGVFLR